MLNSDIDWSGGSGGEESAGESGDECGCVRQEMSIVLLHKINTE